MPIGPLPIALDTKLCGPSGMQTKAFHLHGRAGCEDVSPAIEQTSELLSSADNAFGILLTSREDERGPTDVKDEHAGAHPRTC